MSTSVSAAEARRIALAAQGFGTPRPESVGTRQLNSLISRINLLQLDSVNVFERSHYLPAFARLGGYDKSALDRLTMRAKAPYIEYWAHQAALIPVTDRPLFQWRMDMYRDELYTAERETWVARNGPLMEFIRAELRARGPLKVSQIDHDATKRKGNWWGWSDVKLGMEYMFFWGEITVAGRQNFERSYGLSEQLLPTSILDQRIDKIDAIRELVRRSAAALGIATLADLADYYRIHKTQVKVAVGDLVASGELLPVTADGWKDTAYVWHEARRPRRVDAAALLSPFDPVVWFRPRTERLFDFHYRIEIYTPAPKRVFGYYSLPILLGDRVVGRIDLKNDRQARVLRVQSAWQEASADADTATRLVPLLRQTAAWQGLDSIVVSEWGNLTAALSQELQRE